MPMMITAVGEVDHYVLPLSELGNGAYTVAWRATSSGLEYQGTFSFRVEDRL
jgi:methionine-rich copper-binding protein CopC